MNKIWRVGKASLFVSSIRSTATEAKIDIFSCVRRKGGHRLFSSSYSFAFLLLVKRRIKTDFQSAEQNALVPCFNRKKSVSFSRRFLLQSIKIKFYRSIFTPFWLCEVIFTVHWNREQQLTAPDWLAQTHARTHTTTTTMPFKWM